MNARLFTCMLSGLLAAPIHLPAFGGWATISVEELPDYAVPGRAFELVFTIKQHGVEPLDRLSPSIDFVNGRTNQTVAATATNRKGQYRARVEFPTAGDWTVTINSGFGTSRVTLIPITAIQVGGALPALAESERGRRLFAAKGCVMCHTHADVPPAVSWNVGPDLTGRRYPSEVLEARLVNPKSAMPDAKMPNPELKPAEIAALTAFINQERSSRE
jgi:mono/diheme cytochrome c family protein